MGSFFDFALVLIESCVLAYTELFYFTEKIQ